MKDQRPSVGLDRFRRLGRPSLLGRESLALVLLSAGDLFVTYSLLWHEKFYEANPVARWFFDRWNVAGLTVFKFGLIAFVIVLGEKIEEHRPGVGRTVLLLGCLAAAVVMVHGLRLLSAG